MGDPKKNRKRYERPSGAWTVGSLEEDLKLMGQYGLRNKRELSVHRTEFSKYRKLARNLLSIPAKRRAEKEKELLGKLQRLGLAARGSSLDSVLDLTLDDLLERRLQTVVLRLGLAKSAQQARQLIAHGHISVEGRVTRAPSYYVGAAEERFVTYTDKSPIAAEDHPTRVSIEAVQSTRKMKEAAAEFA